MCTEVGKVDLIFSEAYFEAKDVGRKERKERVNLPCCKRECLKREKDV